MILTHKTVVPLALQVSYSLTLQPIANRFNSNMAKSDIKRSKSDSTGSHHEHQSNMEVSQPTNKPAPKKTSKALHKGYVMVEEHVPARLIISDPKAPENIINGKRSRAKPEKPIAAAPTKNAAVKKKTTAAKKTGTKRSAPVKKIHGREASDDDNDDNNPSESEPEPEPESEHEREPNPERQNIAPKTIHRSVLDLVKHSLKVSDNVASYMQAMEDDDHEKEGRSLDRDVDKVLSSRLDKKRKATKQKTGKKGKAARK